MNLDIPCFARLRPPAPTGTRKRRTAARRSGTYFRLAAWDATQQDWVALPEDGTVRTFASLNGAVRARAEAHPDAAIEQYRGRVLTMRLLPPLPLNSLNAYRGGANRTIPRNGLTREEIIARARAVFGDDATFQIVGAHGRVYLEDGTALRFHSMHHLLDLAELHAAGRRA